MALVTSFCSHYAFTNISRFDVRMLQLTVKSVRDTKVGVIFDPQSLIQALTGLISEHMDARLAEPDPLTENVTSVC
ncbi:unnamed protein product [Triticum turgidum subsp. durum]|uniref:Uncharacterized protein n=1 Tax=Triticum turgidum subsp. durum TaxID=4567 RepID=A0A9R1QJ44_TRITD|nr:unnamed protein product [Triticum turgidum subsp. durum]